MSTARVGLLKRAWHEIPDVVGSSIMGLIGLGITAFAVTTYYQKDGDNRRYKDTYTVIRDDDPLAKKVRKD